MRERECVCEREREHEKERESGREREIERERERARPCARSRHGLRPGQPSRGSATALRSDMKRELHQNLYQ